MAQAEIGVFGGSGFYSFLENVETVKVDTPYGSPSDMVSIGEIAGRRVAFLPRHSRQHSIPPHMINYRANLWAMKELGVARVVSPCAAGSLQARVKPGDFVVCDQYVDRTTGRKDTFYDGPTVHHVSPADPYCPTLRRLAIDAVRTEGIEVHDKGTVVIIQGPRFSTKAESKWFTSNGWEVINMTQYPEAYLARELAMCVVNISLITDYDSGLVAEGEVSPVNAQEVMHVFHKNAERIRKVIFGMIAQIPKERDCPCGQALDFARVTL
ncbi:MAG: S-methyl-5'-thioadenosine phosphorylase [Armatimonadetes bacterium]|nr:S-methyl-5'-thioadenosine phosphorylase [Armatimonadota bacterium]